MSSTSTVSDEAGLTHAVGERQVHGHTERRLDARLIARGGGAFVVWLAVFVPYHSQYPATGVGCIALTIAAAIWIAAVRSAQSTVPPPIGIGHSTAIGSFTGL